MTEQEKLAKWVEQQKTLAAQAEANLEQVPAEMREAQLSVIGILKANTERV